MVGGMWMFYSLNKPNVVASDVLLMCEGTKHRQRPRWMSISTLCRKKKVERDSCVATNMLRPIASISSAASWPHAPNVSTANGMKMCAWLISAYFERFQTSAADAAAPAWKVVFARCKGASVSGRVKSQTNDLSPDQGTSVMPSGFLLSPLRSSGGSSLPGHNTAKSTSNYDITCMHAAGTLDLHSSCMVTSLF